MSKVWNLLIVSHGLDLRLCPLAVSWIGKLIILAYKHCNWDFWDTLKIDLVSLKVNEFFSIVNLAKVINLLDRSCIHEPFAVISFSFLVVEFIFFACELSCHITKLWNNSANSSIHLLKNWIPDWSNMNSRLFNHHFAIFRWSSAPLSKKFVLWIIKSCNWSQSNKQVDLPLEGRLIFGESIKHLSSTLRMSYICQVWLSGLS